MDMINMILSLDEATIKRIKTAAASIERSSHWLIKQAILNYLEKLENNNRSPEFSSSSDNCTDEDEKNITFKQKKHYQPFLDFATKQILPQLSNRAAITTNYYRSEIDAVPILLEQAHLPQSVTKQIYKLAWQLTTNLRDGKKVASNHISMMQKLLQEFSLSSQEGIALMCLAEALLRIPDRSTRDALIREKISYGNWQSHIGHSSSLFVNAATWSLLFTRRLISIYEKRNFPKLLNHIIKKSSNALIRQGIDMAMSLLGKQFIIGETIIEALTNARKLEKKGFCHSYDMLGEAALTATSAQIYMSSYQNAIHMIGKTSNGLGIYKGPGISIKLSALHPRYSRAQYDRVMSELYPRLKSLTLLAKKYDISINIDAEEADRLEISLDLLEKLCFEPDLKGWNGIGFAIQAYQKRCLFVIDYLMDLAARSQHRLMIRLVKGAYWDNEIKQAQVKGLEDYPVYTRKVYTDVSYIACAKKLLTVPKLIYPQFATHNAHTLASIYYLAGEDYYPLQYEFQCLYGMGEQLYRQVIGKISHGKLNRPCRIYAPVGTYETLLSYLVRRLLENGANTSFVNRIADTHLSIDELIADPIQIIKKLSLKEGQIGLSHPNIPLPRNIYGKARINSIGLDLTNEHQLALLSSNLLNSVQYKWKAKPILEQPIDDGEMQPVVNPAKSSDIVGFMREASKSEVEQALKNSVKNASIWFATLPHKRADILERAAILMEDKMYYLISILVREAGKTFNSAIAEVREAVDFLRYYASQVRHDFNNQTHYSLGTIVCISPWNFPLAIFIGQIAAALSTGNSVIAKPAEQTPLIAAYSINILLEAGIPAGVVQLVLGKGETIGTQLTSDIRVRGIMFTGSTEVAVILQRNIITTRLDTKESNIPLIAETGGINAMIVDSSALTEQVVADVLVSAFDSAGQRCSALRVLCLQEEVADYTLEMLRGAMAEYRIGNPDCLYTDIGPVIDIEAKANIEQYIQDMRIKGYSVFRSAYKDNNKNCKWNNSTFVVPTLIELTNLDELKKEIFGPVLHVIRYNKNSLNKLIEQINASGYGLTLGIHTRIDNTISQITDNIKVGNLYVNRNMIGAVVGVQPFGGENLSGTGPKAGGPLYLYRLLSKYPGNSLQIALARQSDAYIVDTYVKKISKCPLNALIAWAESRPYLQLLCKQYGKLTQTGIQKALCGPTGEHNIWMLLPRKRALCIADNEKDTLIQLAATMAVGCRILWIEDELHYNLAKQLPKEVSDRINFIREILTTSYFDTVIYHGNLNQLYKLYQKIIECNGAIVTIQSFTYGDTNLKLELLYLERSLSINTTAAGGNASLMML